MDFNITNVTGITSDSIGDLINGELTLTQDVEQELFGMGLSEGEVRQALLDYIREDISNKDIQSFVNNLATKFNINTLLTNENVSTELGQESIMQRVDDFIYALDNNDILGYWIFSNNKIILIEEDN